VEMARDGKPNDGFPPRLEIANNAIPTFPQVPPLFSLLTKPQPAWILRRTTCPKHAGQVITMLVLSPVFFWPVLR